MAVIYRCDACNKLVENDEDIVKMKFVIYSMHKGVPDNNANFITEYKDMCTNCRNKILNFGNVILKEEKDNG